MAVFVAVAFVGFIMGLAVGIVLGTNLGARWALTTALKLLEENDSAPTRKVAEGLVAALERKQGLA